MTIDNVKLVVTGGPGGGKTTAADLFFREYPTYVTLVNEAATMLFSSGMARNDNPLAQQATQKAIYHLQTSLEEIASATHPQKILLCDRGRLDGLAYWPGSENDFFSTFQTTMETELSRYYAVLFFETAAAGKISIDNNNPVRTESQKEALLLDQKLQSIWKKHPRFIFIPHQTSFLKKISQGLLQLGSLIKELQQGNRHDSE